VCRGLENAVAAQEVMRVSVCFYMYNQMPRRMLCAGERVNERGEPVTSKTCCKQSLEEGMSVAKKVHGGGLARMEVAYVEP